MNKEQHEFKSSFAISLDILWYYLLSSLFSLDDIREGRSLNTLNQIHGIQGLSNGIRTCLHNGISTDSSSISERTAM